MSTQTTINTSRLDFQNIKARLRTFFAQQDEFQDYDFEASGLSNILDVLAWNTHINGLTANFATNEAFLTTAQLRSSVVSLAESLGYFPRSARSAIAYVNLSVNLSAVPSRPASIVLPERTRFQTSVNNFSYTFQTREPFTAVDNGAGIYTFQTSDGSDAIPIYEGVERTKIFYVDTLGDDQVYVIPDATADTSTMFVDVFPSPTSTAFARYTLLIDALSIDSTSTLYTVRESPNGFYEVIFSNGVITGQSPQVGNRIEVNYLSTAGADANSATVFTPTTSFIYNGIPFTIQSITAAAATGGSAPESIESIRRNAPLAFSSQQRLVTAEDYKAQILSRYSFIEDAVAWGGEDNNPPQYGRTYVSLLFSDGTTDDSKDVIKTAIVNELTNNLSVMSIDTVFVDPEVTYLEFNFNFNFDPDLSSVTANTMEQRVLQAAGTFFDENVTGFGRVFRRSNLLSEIEDISSSVLNVSTGVVMQRRFVPIVEGNETAAPAEETVVLTFPAPIAPPNTETITVSSSSFVYNGNVVRVVNKIGENKLQVQRLDNVVVVDNVGSYNAQLGVVTISGIRVDSVIDGSNTIKVKAIPLDQETVRAVRNDIIDIDLAASFATARVE